MAIASEPFVPFHIDETEMQLVTPSLLSASSNESPVSVTKLQSDDLVLLGIYNIVDALRLVPGMLIAEEFGSGSIIGYHGTNVNVPRRMEVLFNGHSIYRPGYSGLNWQRLALDLADLSSIEIIRGGSVVEYGGNALQATVNLIQNPLATSPSAKFEATYSDNTQRLWAGVKHNFENGQIFLRFFEEDEGGYDLSATGKEIVDRFMGKNMLVSGIIDVGENSLLDFSVMTKRYDFFFPGFLGIDLMNTLAIANNALTQNGLIEDNSDNGVLKLSSSDVIFGVQADWSISANYIHVERHQPIRSCQPAYVFDPLLAKIDASPNIQLVSSDFDLLFETGFIEGNARIENSIVNPLSQNDLDLLFRLGQRMQAIGIGPSYEAMCGSTNTNVEESRYALNSRVKLRISNNLLVSSTIEMRRDEVISETYLGGVVKSDSYNVSSGFEYTIPDKGIINAGIMFEDNDRTPSALSYRLSYIHKISEEQSIRFTHSSSKRLPDIYETERLWRFFYQFEDGFEDYLGQREAYYFRTSTSPDNLQAETNRTFEVGYQITGEFNKYNVNAKLFHEDYINLISEPFDFFDFNLSNNGQNRLQGFEFGGHYQFEIGKIGFSYMNLDSETNTRFEKSLYSRHSGSIWAIIPLSNTFSMGTTVTGNSDIGGIEHLRVDTTFSYKTMLFDNNDVLAQLILRRQPSEFRTFTEFSDTSPNVVRFNNRNQALLNFTINL